MGKSYWFECARCGYRAKVAGRSDRGSDFFVQTIVCQECKELFDAVTRTRVADGAGAAPSQKLLGAFRRPALLNLPRAPKVPPNFQLALNRLRFNPVLHYRWAEFKLQCPVSPAHRVETWSEPGKCPRCGLFLEKNALPYRVWD
jgi:hypothetical protein